MATFGGNPTPRRFVNLVNVGWGIQPHAFLCCLDFEQVGFMLLSQHSKESRLIIQLWQEGRSLGLEFAIKVRSIYYI